MIESRCDAVHDNIDLKETMKRQPKHRRAQATQQTNNRTQTKQRKQQNQKNVFRVPEIRNSEKRPL